MNVDCWWSDLQLLVYVYLMMSMVQNENYKWVWRDEFAATLADVTGDMMIPHEDFECGIFQVDGDGEDRTDHGLL